MGDNNNKNFEMDFSVVQTVYGIALVLGLERVAESIYFTFVEETIVSSDDEFYLAAKITLYVALSLLGIRLFTAANNIRRFVYSHPNSERLTTLAHLPILLIHAFTYYILCRLVSGIESEAILWQQISKFYSIYCGLLILNAIWLGMLLPGRKDKKPEIIWLINNASTAALAFIVLLFTAARSQLQFTMVMTLLLLNSFIDLTKAAKWYLRRIGLSFKPITHD